MLNSPATARVETHLDAGANSPPPLGVKGVWAGLGVGVSAARSTPHPPRAPQRRRRQQGLTPRLSRPAASGCSWERAWFHSGAVVLISCSARQAWWRPWELRWNTGSPPRRRSPLLAAPDSRCSERSLGRPAGATRRGRGQGKHASWKPKHSVTAGWQPRPALCWHIPQLSPGHLFPQKTLSEPHHHSRYNSASSWFGGSRENRAKGPL